MCAGHAVDTRAWGRSAAFFCPAKTSPKTFEYSKSSVRSPAFFCPIFTINQPSSICAKNFKPTISSGQTRLWLFHAVIAVATQSLLQRVEGIIKEGAVTLRTRRRTTGCQGGKVSTTYFVVAQTREKLARDCESMHEKFARENANGEKAPPCCNLRKVGL